MKIKFNQKEETISGSLGISQKRFEEIKDSFFESAKKIAQGSKKTASITDLMEECVKKAKPTKPEELLFIGYIVGSTIEKLSDRREKDTTDTTGNLMKLMMLRELMK